MKEAIGHIEAKRLLFRETFRDESTIRSNIGDPIGATFSNGKVTLAASTGRIRYPEITISPTESCTYRFILKVDQVGVYIASGSMDKANNAGYMALNNNQVYVKSGVFNVYINFAEVDETEWHEWVIVKDVANDNILVYIDGVFAGNNAGEADQLWYWQSFGERYNGVIFGAAQHLDLFEIYNYAMTAEEVANLYSGGRHAELDTVSPIFDISAQSGGIADRWGHSLTLANMSISKDGEVYGMRFNGSSSRVLISPGGLTGDITVLAWVKFDAIGEHPSSNSIFDNGNLLIRKYISDQIIVYSDGASPFASSSGDFTFHKWHMLAITRNSTGVVNIYHNGKISGTANQATDTPVAGTNLYIGNDGVSARTIDGMINDTRIMNGLLTAQQISQLFTSERRRYNV